MSRLSSSFGERFHGPSNPARRSPKQHQFSYQSRATVFPLRVRHPHPSNVGLLPRRCPQRCSPTHREVIHSVGSSTSSSLSSGSLARRHGNARPRLRRRHPSYPYPLVASATIASSLSAGARQSTGTQSGAEPPPPRGTRQKPAWHGNLPIAYAFSRKVCLGRGGS